MVSRLNITPSALPRVRQCLGSAILPTADEESEGMGRGTGLHSYMRALTKGRTPEEALLDVPEEHRADAESIDLSTLPPLANGSPEVGFALRLSDCSARVLGVDMDRAGVRAMRTQDEMGMLLDWVGTVGARSLVVVDWKFQRQEDLAPASEHWQLLTYMSAALLAYDADEVQGFLAHWRYGRWEWDSVQLDWLGAQAHLADVRALMSRAERARVVYAERREVPPLRLGAWCDWCPAKRQCPAKVGAALAVLSGEAGEALEARSELTPERAGELWWRLKNHALPALEQMVRDLESIARTEPLPLPDGETLMEVEEGEDKVVAVVAGDWLSKHLGPEVAAEAVETKPTCSWASLERAVRKHHLPKLVAEWEAGGRRGRKPSLAKVMAGLREEMLGVQVAKRATWKAVRAVKALNG